MKTFKELGTLLARNTYRIYIPARTFPSASGASVEFNACIKDYTIVDKGNRNIIDRLTPYQVEKSFEDNIFAYEDEYGRIVLFKMKDEYKVELLN